MVRPDAGQTICLKFLTDRELIPLGSSRSLLRLNDLIIDSEDRLDVMADFVGDDVGLREVTRSVQLLLHLIVETEIDVDLVVTGTIERSGRRSGRAACRLDGVGKEYELRLRILCIRLRGGSRICRVF